MNLGLVWQMVISTESHPINQIVNYCEMNSKFSKVMCNFFNEDNEEVIHLVKHEIVPFSCATR